MLLVIDNYDSFAHNLARYFARLGATVEVVRNDALTIANVEQMAPEAIVLSPGPCTPNEAGISLEVVNAFVGALPMLGVCLGHQTIAQALGGRVVRGPRPWHGRSSEITHGGSGIFADVPSPFEVGRYHSLVVEPESLPSKLEPVAWTNDGTLMAFAHRDRPVIGLQFHPESILTQHGYSLLANFLHLAGIETQHLSTDLAAKEYRVASAPKPLPNRPVTF